MRPGNDFAKLIEFHKALGYQEGYSDGIIAERSAIIAEFREWAVDNYTEKPVGLWIEMPELLEKLDSMEDKTNV